MSYSRATYVILKSYSPTSKVKHSCCSYHTYVLGTFIPMLPISNLCATCTQMLISYSRVTNVKCNCYLSATYNLSGPSVPDMSNPVLERGRDGGRKLIRKRKWVIAWRQARLISVTLEYFYKIL